MRCICSAARWSSWSSPIRWGGAAAVALVRFAVPGPATDAATLLAYEVLLCALAVGLLIGVLRWPWERANVADLVVELGEARSGTLRDELARALGDPSLQIGYWLPESATFVDAAGRPLAVPGPGSGRAATMVERDGQPLAVLVHDLAVLGDRGLAEAVSSATGLAAVNARLQAEVRARLAEIAASRRRILAAADEERGRLEARLRDGAQRRLGELAQALRLARQSAAGQDTAGRIAKAEAQLAHTREDLGRSTALFTVFVAGGAAVILLAAGLISGVARARAERRAVAAIAASLGQAPAPGTLQAALAVA